MKQLKQARLTGFAKGILLAAPLLGSILSAHSQAPVAGESIAAPSIAIESQPMEGAAVRADEPAIKGRLAETAANQAAITLKKSPLAARGLTLTGTIRLPLSLPPRVIGLRAHDRKGTFVTAQFVLRGADGKSVAEQNVALEWDDVRWLTGAPKRRRNRPLNDVLEDAARKAVVRAVKQLAAKNRP